MNLKAKTIYSIIWYGIFGTVIYFVNVRLVDIAMLLLTIFITFAAFKMASNLKYQGEDYKGQLYLAFFQLVLGLIVGLIFFYQ